jgi:DNA-binding beta-propeller fold protein YncE
VPANDLAYSADTGMLYASVPSSAGPSLGNSIVPVDPNTGTIGTPIFVGSEPGKMALSSDGTVLWVALNGAGALRQVNLTTRTAGLQFSLGGGTGIYNPPEKAQALAVMPGSPNTVAVSSAVFPSSSVTIYDSGVARANTQNMNALGLAFDATGTKLYEAGSGYWLANVDSTGISSASELNTSVNSNGLRVDSGRAYLTSGVILDANLGTQLGIFSAGQGQTANGPVAPDATAGDAFVLINAFQA